MHCKETVATRLLRNAMHNGLRYWTLYNKIKVKLLIAIHGKFIWIPLPSLSWSLLYPHEFSEMFKLCQRSGGKWRVKLHQSKTFPSSSLRRDHVMIANAHAERTTEKFSLLFLVIVRLFNLNSKYSHSDKEAAVGNFYYELEKVKESESNWLTSCKALHPYFPFSFPFDIFSSRK